MKGSQSDKTFSCETVATFSGGRRADKIFRSKIYPHPIKENSSLIFAGDPEIEGFYVWDVLAKETVQKIVGLPYIYDVSFMKFADSSRIALALAERSVFIYKWSYRPYYQ